MADASGAMSGAASGAAVGTAVLPGIGTAVGAIGGAIAGLFGGGSHKTSQAAPSDGGGGAPKVNKHATVYDEYGHKIVSAIDSNGDLIALKNSASIFGDKKFLIGVGIALVAVFMAFNLNYTNPIMPHRRKA